MKNLFLMVGLMLCVSAFASNNDGLSPAVHAPDVVNKVLSLEKEQIKRVDVSQKQIGAEEVVFSVEPVYECTVTVSSGVYFRATAQGFGPSLIVACVNAVESIFDN